MLYCERSYPIHCLWNNPNVTQVLDMKAIMFVVHLVGDYIFLTIQEGRRPHTIGLLIYNVANCWIYGGYVE